MFYPLLILLCLTCRIENTSTLSIPLKNLRNNHQTCSTDIIQKLWQHPLKPLELLQKCQTDNCKEPLSYAVNMHKFLPPFSVKDFFPYELPGEFSLELTFHSQNPVQQNIRKDVISKWAKHFKILIFQAKTALRQVEIYADADILRVTISENGTLITQGHFKIGTNYQILNGRKHTISISVQNHTVRLWKDCLPVQAYNPKGFVFIYYNTEYPITGDDFFQIRFEEVNLISLNFYCDPTTVESLECQKLTNDPTLAQNYTLDLIYGLTGRKPTISNNSLINELPYYRFPKPINVVINPIGIFHPEFIIDYALEIVFRINNNSLNLDDGWPIFHIESKNNIMYGDTVISIKLWSQHHAITLILSQQLTTQSCIEITIPKVEVFDGKWHRLVMSFTRQTVQFWIDCVSKKNTDQLHVAEYLPFIRELIGKMRIKLTNVVDINKYKIYRNPHPHIKCDDLKEANNDDHSKDKLFVIDRIIEKPIIFPQCTNQPIRNANYSSQPIRIDQNTEMVSVSTLPAATEILNDSLVITEKAQISSHEVEINVDPEISLKMEYLIGATSILTIILTGILIIYRRQILLYSRNGTAAFRRYYNRRIQTRLSGRENQLIHMNNRRSNNLP